MGRLPRDLPRLPDHLVGSNGAGKTTLLRTIMGLMRPWQGTRLVRGPGRDPPAARTQKPTMGLVLIPEGRQLFTDMTVLENLEMGASPRRARDARRNLERVFALFPRLKERMGQKAGTLSGGEQQMAAIARGLMAEPRLLMLDEPTLGLSPLLVQNLHSIVRQLHDQRPEHVCWSNRTCTWRWRWPTTLMSSTRARSRCPARPSRCATWTAPPGLSRHLILAATSYNARMRAHFKTPWVSGTLGSMAEPRGTGELRPLIEPLLPSPPRRGP